MTDYVALDASKNIAITADVAGVDAIKSMVEHPARRRLRCARQSEDAPADLRAVRLNRLVHEFIARDLGGITYGA